MWAFGSSLATAAAQSQQPFLYTFQMPTHPSEIEIPGILPVVESVDVDVDVEEREGGRSPPPPPGEKESKEEPSSTRGQEVPATPATEDTTTTNEIMSSKEGKPDASTATVASEKSQTEEKTPIDTETATTATATTTTAKTPDSESTATATATATTAPSNHPPKPTFATVPEGHPEFTDACINYPNQPCPVSGQWKGHFQNMAGTRPRDKIQKVQETFYLFLNATPGPDVRYAFDETPLPPTVHKESLVQVRGR